MGLHIFLLDMVAGAGALCPSITLDVTLAFLRNRVDELNNAARVADTLLARKKLKGRVLIVAPEGFFGISLCQVRRTNELKQLLFNMSKKHKKYLFVSGTAKLTKTTKVRSCCMVVKNGSLVRQVCKIAQAGVADSIPGGYTWDTSHKSAKNPSGVGSFSRKNKKSFKWGGSVVQLRSALMPSKASLIMKGFRKEMLMSLCGSRDRLI